MSVGGTQSAAVPGRHRRIARPGAALAVGVIIVILIAAAAAVAAVTGQLTLASAAEVLLYLAFGLVGLVVAWHQPRNPMGWVLLGVTFFFGLEVAAGTYSVLDYRLHGGRLPLGWLAVLLIPCWAPALVLAGLSVLLFPDGRIPSGRWKPVLWAYLATGVLWLGGAFAIALGTVLQHHVSIDATGGLSQLDNPSGGTAWFATVQDVFFLVVPVCWLSWLSAKIVTYRHATGERRLQLKWLLSGVSVFIACAIGLVAASNGAGWLRVVTVLGAIGTLALPVSIGFGILKFRLYDIDRIVSRTLAYAIVTGLLIGVYAGLVLLATQVLRFHSSVAVAIATLAAAALFAPARRRVQRAVDRRFNRARYDADRTVAAFAARLQDQVELGQVRADLIEVVNGVLEPQHSSVWTRPS
jgi:hypothetical protein